jgi:hypothetical protein
MSHQHPAGYILIDAPRVEISVAFLKGEINTLKIINGHTLLRLDPTRMFIYAQSTEAHRALTVASLKQQRSLEKSNAPLGEGWSTTLAFKRREDSEVKVERGKLQVMGRE